MELSKYFLPILKENPQEAQIASHRLMLRSGMIKQQASGIYSWLPLGCKVLKNIENIVRKNLEKYGCIEILMPCVQPANLWHESGRYDDYGPEMLRFRDRHDNELLFGPTAEEIATDIFKASVKSYKELPKILFQIQWKFRDEIRPRFGVMRGREFLMKDAYSFDIDEDSALNSYKAVFEAYCKIFQELDLKFVPVKADSGPIGGKYNHEFQVVADTGESKLFYDKKFDELMNEKDLNLSHMENLYAASDEMHVEEKCPVDKEDLVERRGIEIGHIFYFGTKYSDKMNLLVNDKTGKLSPVHMGSYGIGISRLVGAIIEANHDEKGIIWPESVAPFKISIINLSMKDQECCDLAYDIYYKLKNAGIEVLIDDTNESAGSKFATHDLIGSPWHVIIGKKFKEKGEIEVKSRRTGEVKNINREELMEFFINKENGK